MSLSEEDLAHIRLARTKGIGPLTFQMLLQKYGSARDALAAYPELAKRRTNRNVDLYSKRDLEIEVKRTEAFGAKFLLSSDENFPSNLTHLDPAPPVLTIKGDVSILSKPTIAMVGARNASAAAIRIAHDFAGELGGKGYTIVSGLARGIDTASHTGSLKTGTVAVISGGVDNVYPPQNAGLFEQISDTGLIVSESIFGYSPRAHDFPRRNRIITGLSNGTIVVEGAVKSGSLISARTAAEQGREVMVVPGSPLDPRSHGSNELIRSGATLVQCVDDIIEAVSNTRPNQGQLFEKLEHLEFEDAFDSDNYDEPLAAQILQLTSPIPVSLQHLAQSAKITVPICASIIVELELDQLVQTLAGGFVIRR